MLHVLRWPRLAPTPVTPVLATRFPWLWFLAAPLAATLWTAVALTQNNLELQSIDLCHHAMFVEHLNTPFGGADLAFTGQYPLLSHRVAAIWMPVYHNPIMAVRAAALTSLLVMFVAQWYLLRTALPPAKALLALVAWQALCTNCKLGDVNHFLWEFQYNYSRAVSAAALWVMLLSFAVPFSRHRLLNLLFAVGCAAFAFRCHIAAGSLGLGACGTWCVVNVIRRDWLTGVGGLMMLAVTGAMLLLFTDEWRYLASLSADNGPLPIRHADLIALWIPTAIVGLGFALWRSMKGRELKADLSVAVLCGLLPAALLQGYMLYGKTVAGTVGSYPYNQMLFYTFGLASLFWFALFAGRTSDGWNFPSLACRANFHTESAWLRITAVLAAGWGLYTMLETDARRSRLMDNPISVLAGLRPMKGGFAGHYYYDPDLELGSYFVSRCLLGAGSDYCARYRLHLHQRKPWDLYREPMLRGLYLPPSADPAKLLPGCPCERDGNYWKCDLKTWRASGELERQAAIHEKRT